MRKLLVLTLVVAAIAPLEALALTTADDTLAYVAMPLAVSDVCDVRGVQTDQVANLAVYLDQARVSPEGFIDVFRYVPVALTFNSGNRPDFVQWVGNEVDQGVIGDELVSAMEGRIRIYGGITVPRTSRRRYDRPYYDVAFEPDYVPIDVQQYCENELVDPFALIDMPVAVADVCDLGVPYDRAGRFVAELDLGDVAPWQTVELLRYAPPALFATGYGQPDFVQYVYEQRTGGLGGGFLARAASQRLSTYYGDARIEAIPPASFGRNRISTEAVRTYVSPADPAYVTPLVRTRIASGFAPGRAFQSPVPAPQIAPSPQVTRLLGGNGGRAVVSSPAQAHRELERATWAEREAAHRTIPPGSPLVAGAPPGSPLVAGSPHVREAGHRMIPTGAATIGPTPPIVATTHRGEGRHEQIPATGGFRTFAPPANIAHRPVEGVIETRHSGGRVRVATPGAVVAAPPQVIHPRGQPQVASQPLVVSQPKVSVPHVEVSHVPPGPPRPVVTAAPQPQVLQNNGHNGAPGGNPPGQKKKGKDQ